MCPWGGGVARSGWFLAVVSLALGLFLGLLAPCVALREEQKLGLEVKWRFNTSDQFPGRVFGVGHQGPPTVFDIDEDGENEVLWGTRRGDSKRLWCIGSWPTPELEWVYPPIDEDGLPGDPTSKVSIIDVDNDGVYELALGGRGGRLHVLNGDGSVKWTWDNPNVGDAMHGAPQAFDVDGDGFVEFFINDNMGFIHRVDDTGNLVWTSFQSGGNNGHPTIADIDRDGEYEVVWASEDHNVYCISARDGGEKWRFDAGSNMQTNQVIVVDVNEDGEYELLAWSIAPSNAVFCIDPYGREVWRWVLPREGIIRLCQAIGDVDGDGRFEMAIMSSVGAFLVDIGGVGPVTEWEINVTEWSEQGLIGEGAQVNKWSSYQTIADIDGDGQQEILWLAPFPIVTDAATGVLEAYYWNEHVRRNNRAENGGWWGDADGDGVSEWIVELTGHTRGSDTLLYALTMGGESPAKSPWPEYYHSAYPAEYQQEQEWLTLKAAYSNSLWFPIPQFPQIMVSIILALLPSLVLVIYCRHH
jgi:hypothetical protein